MNGNDRISNTVMSCLFKYDNQYSQVEASVIKAEKEATRTDGKPLGTPAQEIVVAFTEGTAIERLSKEFTYLQDFGEIVLDEYLKYVNGNDLPITEIRPNVTACKKYLEGSYLNKEEKEQVLKILLILSGFTSQHNVDFGELLSLSDKLPTPKNSQADVNISDTRKSLQNSLYLLRKRISEEDLREYVESVNDLKRNPDKYLVPASELLRNFIFYIGHVIEDKSKEELIVCLWILEANVKSYFDKLTSSDNISSYREVLKGISNYTAVDSARDTLAKEWVALIVTSRLLSGVITSNSQHYTESKYSELNR